MLHYVSLLLVVGGIALVASGLIASESIASGFSKFFTGAPTDKTMWMLIAGLVLAMIGLAGVFRHTKSEI